MWNGQRPRCRKRCAGWKASPLSEDILAIGGDAIPVAQALALPPAAEHTNVALRLLPRTY
jgi:hypothetical protein